MLRAGAKAFMEDHVIPGIPPAPRDIADCLLLFPRSIQQALVATPEVEAALQQMAIIDAEIKGLESQKEEKSTIVRRFMGDYGSLLKQGRGEIATYRNNKDSIVTDWKAYAAALEVELGKHVMDANTYVSDIRQKFTTTKPGVRPLRNLLKVK